jgi:hypothetical protein
LSTHSWKEPINLLLASQQLDQAPLEIITPQIGEVYNFTLSNYSKNWWENVN